MKTKRKLPDKEKISKRKEYMKDMEKLIAIEPQSRTPPRGMEKRVTAENCLTKYLSGIFHP